MDTENIQPKNSNRMCLFNHAKEMLCMYVCVRIGTQLPAAVEVGPALGQVPGIVGSEGREKVTGGFVNVTICEQKQLCSNASIKCCVDMEEG